MSVGAGLAIGLGLWPMAAMVVAALWHHLRITQLRLEAYKDGIAVEYV